MRFKENKGTGQQEQCEKLILENGEITVSTLLDGIRRPIHKSVIA